MTENNLNKVSQSVILGGEKMDCWLTVLPFKLYTHTKERKLEKILLNLDDHVLVHILSPV